MWEFDWAFLPNSPYFDAGLNLLSPDSPPPPANNS
jgi:hypothetical protein